MGVTWVLVMKTGRWINPSSTIVSRSSVRSALFSLDKAVPLAGRKGWSAQLKGDPGIRTLRVVAG